MQIVLLGYMGSGKSSIGKRLANVLNYNFIDLDEYISRKESQSISEIFSKKGEIYFRKKEKTSLTSIFNEEKEYVLATGGGTPVYSNIMDLISSSENIISIYLKATPNTLTDRLFDEKHIRPLISHLESKSELYDFIRKHLFERNFYYSQADKTIEVDNQSINQVVEKIIAQLF